MSLVNNKIKYGGIAQLVEQLAVLNSYKVIQ